VHEEEEERGKAATAGGKWTTAGAAATTGGKIKETDKYSNMECARPIAERKQQKTTEEHIGIYQKEEMGNSSSYRNKS
jgi:hypothetical protein